MIKKTPRGRGIYFYGEIRKKIASLWDKINKENTDPRAAWRRNF